MSVGDPAAKRQLPFGPCSTGSSRCRSNGSSRSSSYRSGGRLGSIIFRSSNVDSTKTINNRCNSCGSSCCSRTVVVVVRAIGVLVAVVVVVVIA